LSVSAYLTHTTADGSTLFAADEPRRRVQKADRSPDAAGRRTPACKMTTCDNDDQEVAEEHGCCFRALDTDVPAALHVCSNPGLDRLPRLVSV
jgi:hypothetical protein